MSDARARRRLSRPGAVLALLVAASAAGRVVAGLGMEGLWIAPDEMIYGSLGRSLWEDGSLRILGGEPAVYSVVYPAIAGLPLVVLGLEAGLDAVDLVQSVLMSLAAVPVYLWSRRLTGPGWALLAAALTLAVPAFVYTGLLMSETTFYPATALAAWAAAAALERPTLLRQGLLVGALVLAAATRLQGLALALAFGIAVVLFALLRRDLRQALRLWPSLAALAVLGAAWVGYRTAAAGSPLDALGAYTAVGEAAYEPGAVARFAAYHAADLLLVTGIVPVVAAALLTVETLLRGRAAPPELAAYVAVAFAFVGLTVAVVGAFASEHVGLVFERGAVGVAPVLFVGLAAWLGRGAPRPRLATAAVALGALGLVLALPLRDVLVWETLPDSFTLVPLLRLGDARGVETAELVLWSAVAAALALVALLPRRAVPSVAVLGLAWLAFASYDATQKVSEQVAFHQQYLIGGKRSWIDAASSGSVGYLYTGDPVNLVWQEAFWNERLRRVYLLEGRGAEEGLPAATPVAVRPNGILVDASGEPLPHRFLVATSDLRVAGEPLDGIEIREFALRGLTLWRLDGPARLTWYVTGVKENGDMHEPGRVTAYGCGGGSLELTLLPKASTRVELRLNGEPVQALDVAGESVAYATVPVPEGVERCEFEIVPDSLLGSTRIEFVYS